MHTTHKEIWAIPTPIGPFLARVRTGCGGRIPDRSVPAAFVLALWAIDGVADDEREIYQRAAQHWTLCAAFTCVGDVARHITFASALYPRGDAR